MTKRFNRSRSFYPRAFLPRQRRPLRLGGGLGPDLRLRAINLRSALATTALATGVLMGASAWSPQQAQAGCVDTFSAPNGIFCDAARTTIDATIDITAFGGAANDVERHYLFTADGDVDVEITPTGDIDGFGLAVTTTEAGAQIIVDHDGEITLDGAPTEGGFSAFNLNTVGGDITYSGSGTIDGTGFGVAGLGMTSTAGGNIDATVESGGSIIGNEIGVGAVALGGGEVTITNQDGGHIEGVTGAGVYVLGSGDVTIHNDATILGNSSGAGPVGISSGAGVQVVSGNIVTLTNTSFTSIIGDPDGVDIANVAQVNIVNDGALIRGLNGHGIVLTNIGAGGIDISNRFGGLIEGLGTDGINITNSAAADVNIDNRFAGEIIGNQDGIDIDAAGNVTIENANGLIEGINQFGIRLNQVGAVAINNNDGEIRGGAVGVGINFGDNITLANRNGVIVGGTNGVQVQFSGNVAIDNSAGGLIEGTTGTGIVVTGSGNVDVDNSAGGTILGGAIGLRVIGSGNVTVDNRVGAITGTTGDGIQLDNVGVVAIDNRDGTITGGDDGIDVDTALAVRIRNQGNIGPAGTILGDDDGVNLANIGTGGVRVDNRFGGSIIGTNDDGIDVDGSDGDVTILNRIGGFISGADDGVDIDDVTGDVLVDNRRGGEIIGGDNGVEIEDVFGTVTVDNRSGGSISGGNDGVQIQGVTGTVLVDNRLGGSITGTSDDGVDIKDVSGNVTVDNRSGGFISGGDSGVEIFRVTGDVLVDNRRGGIILGVNEGVEIRGITGNVDIDNGGLIQGRGTLANPVIRAVGVDGDIFIWNQANGVIGSENLPRTDADPAVTLADSLDDLATFRDYRDFFGGPGFLPDAAVDDALALLPDYITAAADVALHVRSTGINTIVNDGFLVGQGRFSTAGDGTLVVNNADGVWLTSGLNTFANSTNDVVENHGLVQTAFDATVDEVTEFVGLDLFDNRGVLSMMDGAEGDRTEISGDYDGTLGEAHLAVDVFFDIEGVGESDVLAIGGDMDGSTAVVINKTNAFPGGLNDEGITVVEIGGDTENACFDVLCQVGDAGFISEQSEDFFAFDGHNFIHDNGLFLWGMTQRDDPADGSRLVLVSDIGPHAAQLPTLITAAQNVWYESTSVVEDHIYGLRFGAAPVYGPLADMPVDDGLYRKGPVEPVVVQEPRRSAVWLKVFGSRTEQDTVVNRNFDGTNTRLRFDTSFDQDTLGIMGGADFGNRIAPDVMFRFGVFGGYTRSDIDYGSLGTTNELRGPLVGGYVSYSSGGFYVDAMGRADFLEMDFESPTIPGGFDGAKEDVTSVGVLANVGYRHEMGTAFIEPIGSFAYVNSDVGSFEVSGSKVSFSGDESLRLGGGGRVGGTLMSGPDHGVEASILGKVWHEFEDNTVTITDPFGAQTTVSDDAKGTFGELTGTVTAYGLDRSWSVFVSGGAKFNSDFVTYGGKGGFRFAF